MYENMTKKDALLTASHTPYAITLKRLPMVHRNNKDIVTAAIKHHPDAMQYMGDKLKQDKDFIIKLMSISGGLLKHVPSKLKNDVDVIRTALSNHKKAIEWVRKKALNDKNIVTNILNIDVSFFEFASQKLKQDKEFILELLKTRKFSSILKFIDDNLKNDITVVRTAVQHSGLAISHASRELRENKELALLAVTNSGSILHSLPAFHNDKDIVLAAVTSYGDALEYASAELRNNPVIVQEAITGSGYSICYASIKLQSNKELALLALKHDASLEDLLNKHRNDKDIVLAAIKNDPIQIKYASNTLLNDRDVILAAVTKDGYAIEYCGSKLANDLELYLEAIHNVPDCSIYLSNSLRKNKVLDFVRMNNKDLGSDWTIIKEALLKNPNAFMEPPPGIKDLCEGMNNKYLYLAQYALSQVLTQHDTQNHTDLVQIEF